MGLVPGDDYEEGGGCSHCFDPSKPVGWQKVPKYINMEIVGATECPSDGANPDGGYLCEWVGECSWVHDDPVWYASFVMYTIDPYTGLPMCGGLVYNYDIAKTCFQGQGAACGLGFSSILTLLHCPLYGAYGGQAIISWGPGIGP